MNLRPVLQLQARVRNHHLVGSYIQLWKGKTIAYRVCHWNRCVAILLESSCFSEQIFQHPNLFGHNPLPPPNNAHFDWCFVWPHHAPSIEKLQSSTSSTSDLDKMIGKPSVFPGSQHFPMQKPSETHIFVSGVLAIPSAKLTINRSNSRWNPPSSIG